MARYRGPVCRLCRREGEKLFLKGERCFTSKCAVEKRVGPPGVHTKLRGRYSEYKTQLREKQKAKRIYGLLERQFRGLFQKAERTKGITGEQLLIALEQRLDNMVYRSGFVSSRKEGRQVVKHGNIIVNGTRVDIPSYKVKPGDVIKVVDSAKDGVRLQDSVKNAQARKMPEWLEVDYTAFTTVVKSLPNRAQLPEQIKEQLIVELYSK
jgi:small subunit ribosomal protein S4